MQYDENKGICRQMRQDFPTICINICLNSNKYNIKKGLQKSEMFSIITLYDQRFSPGALTDTMNEWRLCPLPQLKRRL
mgnify:CR=1 FL=1